MVKKFDNVIEILEQIIEHWFDKDQLSMIVNLQAGLCLNVTDPEDDDYLEIDSALYDCIRDYNIQQNKIENTGLSALFYPVELSFLKYDDDSRNATLYNNPKRFHLAVFMLSWFRQHNIETINESN